MSDDQRTSTEMHRLYSALYDAEGRRQDGVSMKHEKRFRHLLRNHVLYPVELLDRMHRASEKYVHVLKEYSPDILKEWDRFDPDDREILLTMVADEMQNASHSSSALRFVEMEQEGEEEILGLYHKASGEMLLSKKLIEAEAPQALGTLFHEGLHGMVDEFVRNHEDMVPHSPGLRWSSYGDVGGDCDALYPICPEEALVRAVEANMLEMLANIEDDGKNNAVKRANEANFTGETYTKIASAQHYLSHIRKYEA